MMKNLNKDHVSFLNLIAKRAYTKPSLKSVSEIPGPKTYPYIGSLLELKPFGGEYDLFQLINFMNKLNKKYGDIVKWTIFNRTQIFLMNPEHVKKVHQIDGLMPNRKPIRPWTFYYRARKMPIPIFSSVNERWRKLRTAANPIAARPQTIHLYIDKHIEVVQDFIELLKKRMNETGDGKLFDFEKQLKHLALEMVSVLALDSRVNCLDTNQCSDKIKLLIKSVEDFMWYTNKLSVSTPIWRIYETKDRKKLFEAMDNTYNLASGYIREAAAKLTSSANANEDVEKSILQQLILNKEKNGLTIQDIESIMVDFIVAGVDTTSLTLHYIIYELGRNPEIQNQLYNEIIETIKPNEPLTKDNVYKIPFLKLILKEALRFHNVVPILTRILNEDLILDDYLLPKGTVVSACPIFITRSEKYFKNANVFNPNRWSSENSGSIHPYASIPFGYGPRMCLGRRVSEQEIYVTIIKLLQNFKIEYVGETFRYKFGVITLPDKPLNIRLIKRN